MLLANHVTPILCQVCPKLVTSTSSTPKGKAGAPAQIRVGKRATIFAHVRNTGSSDLQNLAVRITLPDYLLPQKASTFPKVKPSSRGRSKIEDTRSIYWVGLPLQAGKTAGKLVLFWSFPPISGSTHFF
jgi:hypothetical protein